MSSREIALIIWGIIIVLILVFNKKSNALTGILESCLNLVLQPIMMIFIMYNLFILVIIHLNFIIIDFEILKDYLLAIILLIPIMVNKDERLTKITKEKIVELFFIQTIVYFIIDEFTFNIIIEIVLIPLFSILIISLVVSETDIKYSPAQILINLIIKILFLSILVWNIYTIIENWENLNFNALFISYFFEVFAFMINIPILFLIHPLVKIDTQVNFYKGDRKIMKFIKYLISKKHIKFKFRKHIREANNLSVNFDILSETIGYGSTRIRLKIYNQYISQEELLVIIFSLITQTKIHSKTLQKPRFPNFIEIINGNMELIAYWEEPMLKLKYKAFKLRQFPYLDYGVKINTSIINKIETTL